MAIADINNTNALAEESSNVVSIASFEQPPVVPLLSAEEKQFLELLADSFIKGLNNEKKR